MDSADTSSADLASAYDKAKDDLDRTADTFTSNYAKKRTMASEVKHFREQREEVKQWERLNRDKVSANAELRLKAGRDGAATFALAIISHHK